MQKNAQTTAKEDKEMILFAPKARYFNTEGNERQTPMNDSQKDVRKGKQFINKKWRERRKRRKDKQRMFAKR